MNARFRRLFTSVSLMGMATALHLTVAHAQTRHTVYGVPPARTTVVVAAPAPRAVVVAPAPRAVVVAPAPVVVGLPSGYIAVLPTGYRIVTVGGARYYYVGGIHYRAEFYQGRTCYVRVRL